MVTGVAIKISKFTLPSLISAKISSFKMTIFLLPISKWGKAISPMFPISIPKIWASILPSNLEREVDLTNSIASERG